MAIRKAVESDALTIAAVAIAVWIDTYMKKLEQSVGLFRGSLKRRPKLLDLYNSVIPLPSAGWLLLFGMGEFSILSQGLAPKLRD